MLCHECRENEATENNNTFCLDCSETPESWRADDENLIARLGAVQVAEWKRAALEAGDDETVIALGQGCECSCDCENTATRRENSSGAWLCADCADYVVMPIDHLHYGIVVCAPLSENWSKCPFCRKAIAQRGTCGPSYCDCARWTQQPDGWHVEAYFDDEPQRVVDLDRIISSMRDDRAWAERFVSFLGARGYSIGDSITEDDEHRLFEDFCGSAGDEYNGSNEAGAEAL